MKRVELEHIIRAASGITKQAEIVIIGSQSILGQFPNASPKLLDSMEADVFPLRRPELSDEIDGVMGELSPFHQTHGIYAHGVAEDTAILPIDWKKRLMNLYSNLSCSRSLFSVGDSFYVFATLILGDTLSGVEAKKLPEISAAKTPANCGFLTLGFGKKLGKISSVPLVPVRWAKNYTRNSSKSLVI